MGNKTVKQKDVQPKEVKNASQLSPHRGRSIFTELGSQKPDDKMDQLKTGNPLNTGKQKDVRPKMLVTVPQPTQHGGRFYTETISPKPTKTRNFLKSGEQKDVRPKMLVTVPQPTQHGGTFFAELSSAKPTNKVDQLKTGNPLYTEKQKDVRPKMLVTVPQPTQHGGIIAPKLSSPKPTKPRNPLNTGKQDYVRPKIYKASPKPTPQDESTLVKQMENLRIDSSKTKNLLQDEKKRNAKQIQHTKQSSHVQHQNPKRGTRCPFRLEQICTTCWKHGVKSQCRDGEDKCQSVQAHIWSENHGYLLVPKNKIIRPLRLYTSEYRRSTLCRHSTSEKHLRTRENCHDAHSNEEIEVWDWMCKNKGIVKLT